MADTSLEIIAKSTDDRKVTTTVSYVNEGASGATLVQFGQMLNALTNNTYEESVRVSKVHLDTEEYIPSSMKPIPTLSVADRGGSQGTITYTGDGTLIAYSQLGNCTIAGSTLTASTSHSEDAVGVICASETDNYAATWASFTVTGEVS